MKDMEMGGKRGHVKDGGYRRRAKKLLIVLPGLEIGGTERAICRLAGALDRSRIVPRIAVFQPGGECLQLLSPNVEVHNLGPCRRWRHIRLIWRLARLMRTVESDLVFSVLHYANLVTLCAKTAGLLRVPLVIGIRSNYRYGLRPGVRWWRLRRLLVRLLYPRADLILCVTEEARQVLIEDYGIPRHLCLTLGNIVPRGSELAARTSAEAPMQMEFDGVVPVVLGVGRLDPVKEFDKLLEAFRILRSERPARLLLLGDGPERERLLDRANRLGLGGDCIFGGMVPEPMAYMMRADCLVVTSRSEGFPNVVAEAIACDLPVVAFDWSHPVVEMVRGTRTGRVVERQDVRALAGAILRTLDGSDLRRRAALSQHPSAPWLVDTPASAYEKVFMALCGEREAEPNHALGIAW